MASASTETVCMVPLVGCLNAAEAELGASRQWNVVNDAQRRFLAEFFDQGRREVKDLPEIESIASRDFRVVNRFLEERGFHIQLSAYTPPDFGVASILKVVVEWLTKGQVTAIRSNQYPAVRLDSPGASVAVSPAAQNPITVLETKNGDKVYLSAYDNPPRDFDLVRLADNIEKRLRWERGYDGVVFPMVSYDREQDISWIVGMSTADDRGVPAHIAEALQQTKFSMNEVGAKVESAAAMKIMRSAPRRMPKRLIIDKPFLLWIRRKGLSQPLFVGHFCEDVWKNPEAGQS
jgi:hypothetical protein